MFNVSVLGEILFNTFNKCKVPHLDFENSSIQMKQTDKQNSDDKKQGKEGLGLIWFNLFILQMKLRKGNDRSETTLVVRGRESWELLFQLYSFCSFIKQLFIKRGS